MASPVTGDSVPTINGSQKACASFKALLQSVRELASLADYLFDDNGLPNVEVVREIGSIIYPPGSLMEIVVPIGTSRDLATRQVEQMWLTDEEKTLYLQDRNSVTPFWVLADQDGRLGAPNLSGRFKLAADWRALDSGNVSGVVGVEAPGGAKSHVLTEGEIPAHSHPLSFVTAKGFDASPQTNRFLFTPPEYSTDPNQVSQTTNWPKLEMATLTGGGKEHNNMPPYYVVAVAYRTSRTT